MNKMLRVILTVLCMAALITGCQHSADGEETQPTRVTTQPAVTTGAETEPLQTTAAPTETEPENPEEILRSVVENQRQLRLESGSVVYLEEYLAMHQGTEAEQWQFLDMNGDGVREIFAVTDSSDVSYLILHWDGTDPRCFGLSFRAVQVLKENGAMAGADSASGMSFYRVEFEDGALVRIPLAAFDTEAEAYTVDGKKVSREKMEAFLKDWNALAEVFGFELSLPEEETYTCAYCGDRVDSPQEELCDGCFWVVDKCDICGKWSEDTFEGVCSDCEPNGGRGGGSCILCGTWCETLEDGLCEDCFWCYDQCKLCGKWSDDTFEGICSECEPNGGMG